MDIGRLSEKPYEMPGCGGGGGGGENDCLTEIAGLPAPRWKGEGVRALARDCGIVLWQVGRLGSSATLLVT